MQFNHPRLLWIQPFQPLQSLVYRQDLFPLRTIGARVSEPLFQRHQRAPSFGGVAFPRVIHQQPSHELPRDPHELRAVLPVRPVLSRQPQKGLVDQRRGLQGVVLPFIAHVAPRQAP